MKGLLSLFFITLSAFISVLIPYSIYVVIFLPGLLFGCAITLPLIYSQIKDNFLQLKIILLYPVLWAIVLWLSAFFEFIIKYSSDKTGCILIGLISGLGVSFLFNWQFGFRSKQIGYISVVTLSIIAILVNNYLFPTSSDKEKFFGEQIAIWQILIGIGIILNQKKKHLPSTTN